MRLALLLSLIGNLVLTWLILSQSGSDSPGEAPRELLSRTSEPASRPGSSTSQARSTDAASNPTPWRPEEMVAFLRAHRFPEEIVVRAVMTAIQLRNREERRRITGVDTWGRWQLIGGKRSSPEVTLALQELQQREEAELARLTGVESLAEQTRQAARLARFGDLTRDKIDAVVRLEADYARFRQMASEAGTNGGTRTSANVRNSLEEEFVRDLAEILSASEVQDYIRYNSDAAHRLQGQLAGVDVTSAVYEKLADASLAHAASSATARSDPARLAELQAQLQDDYHRILGDDDFLRLAPELDRVAASIDRCYAQAGLTFSERTDLFRSTSRSIASLRLLPLARQPAEAAALLNRLKSSPRLTPAQAQELESTTLFRQLRRIAEGG